MNRGTRIECRDCPEFRINPQVGAEVATGDTFAAQFYSQPLAFAIVVATVTYATFVPTAQVIR